VFEKFLMQNRIPYKISGGTSFFSRPEIKDLLAYLRVLTNPDDDSAFLRVVNTPKREIGPPPCKSWESGRRAAVKACLPPALIWDLARP
jgi:ATP-dependent DNA helicase Rep